MLRVFNTLTRTQEPIVPISDVGFSMYSCGPTVYRWVHVGNLRTFLLSDLVRRVLEYGGLASRVVMNITDVGHMTDEVYDAGEDKMLLAARDEGKSPAEIAEFYTEAFHRDLRSAGIKPAHEYPKASDHVPQMIELISKLIERGHAYEDGGSVYYDVASFPEYGALSGQDPASTRAGHRIANDDHHKRSHQDFVLWKSAGPRRVVVFDSPWGKGYPGWHIECSAMSMALLGPRFDIHTGGVDNVFPHHEGEIAQSEGVTGSRVVTTWIHGDHLLLGQSKMAKSAGNVVTVQTLVEQGLDPLALRFLCFTARYRRQINFTDEAIAAANTGLRRLRERIARLDGPANAPSTDAGLRAAVTDPAALEHHERFVRATEDDLDFPEAMKVMQSAVADDGVSPAMRRTLALSWDHVLGLGLAPTGAAVPSDVTELVAARDLARQGRDFAAADAIRLRLHELGYDVSDTPHGSHITRLR